MKHLCFYCNQERYGVADGMCPACTRHINREIDNVMAGIRPKCSDCRRIMTRTEARRNGDWCNECAPEHQREIAKQKNKQARQSGDPFAWLADSTAPEAHREHAERWWRRQHGLLRELESDSSRVRARGSNYGIPIGEWMVIVAQQDGKCGICAQSPEDDDPRKLVIDHDHIDGHVRGLLCQPCNVGLGFLRVDGDAAQPRLQAALEYVRRASVARGPSPARRTTG